jgi:membrane-associated phospholipid phosphatase
MSRQNQFSQSDHFGLRKIRSRFLPALVLQAAAFILVVSWLVPPINGIWKHLDAVVFRGLNETLYWGPVWQQTAAFANSRAFDLLAGALVVSLLAIHVTRGERLRKRSTWLTTGSLALAVVAGRFVFVDGLVHGALGYHRRSPTLVSPDVLRLSQLLPEWPAKDSSPWCFPGDHGYALLCVALFMSYFASRRLAVAAWCLAVAGALPRLVSGAHWFSDIAVGSLALAMLSTSLLLIPAVRDLIEPRHERVDMGTRRTETTRRRRQAA